MPPAPLSPVAPAQVAATRRPVDEASLLPPRVFHDPEVLEFEQRAWFARSWVYVGREEDVARPGAFLQVEVAGQSLIVVRSEDGAERAFHHVCRYRGARVCTESSGRLVRIQCPYHAWTYTLDGRLRRADRVEYHVAADRKVIGKDYSSVITVLVCTRNSSQVWPLEAGRSRVICEWFFHPETMAQSGFHPLTRSGPGTSPPVRIGRCANSSSGGRRR